MGKLAGPEDLLTINFLPIIYSEHLVPNVFKANVWRFYRSSFSNVLDVTKPLQLKRFVDVCID